MDYFSLHKQYEYMGRKKKDEASFASSGEGKERREISNREIGFFFPRCMGFVRRVRDDVTNPFLSVK